MSGRRGFRAAGVAWTRWWATVHYGSTDVKHVAPEAAITPSTPILIVDDDAAHAESTRALLSAHNHRARIELNPREALSWLRDNEVAVLLLDLNMPEMTGVEVLEELVQQGARMKTIVVSGEQEVETVSPLLRLGAYDFMAKPYDPGQLVRSVSHALGEWHLQQENARMEARERKTDELNRFLLDAFPDLLYVLDESGKFSFINRRLEHLFPDSREGLIGRDWRELFDRWPVLAEQLNHHIDERRTGIRATRGLEFDITAASGEQAVLECTARGLYRDATSEDGRAYVGTYGVLQDVTESRRTRRALAQSQRKFQGLFMESPDGVFIATLDGGEVLEGNDIFNQLRLQFGASADPTDAWLWPSVEARTEFVAALLRAPEHLSLSVSRQLGAEERYLEINARVLELENAQCMLGTVRDRTRERHAELQQRELQSQLLQAGKMEALGQLAGGVAHDFNNILASIIGYAELVINARSKLPDDQVEEYLREVVSAGQRARDLISQMLTFTKSNRDEPGLMDLSEVFDEVAGMLRAAIPSTIELVRHFDEDLPPVRLHPVQFQQVVMNLMINARDAIRGTGLIELSARVDGDLTPCAVCNEQIDDRHIVLRIRDSGGGIPDRVLPHIFDMYYTTREPGKGTGIGLWLVNDVVHSYGGHVTVDTSPNGTEFAVHLPLKAAPVQPEAARPVRDDKQITGRIVVVDDEVSVSSFLGEILRHAGFETMVFNESPKAMDYLVTHLDEVAVLLTDQVMPMLSGLDLAQFVKGRRPDLPVVLITGFAHAHDTSRVQEIGVDHFLTKPFGIDTLLDVIHSLTNTPAQAEDAGEAG